METEKLTSIMPKSKKIRKSTAKSNINENPNEQNKQQKRVVWTPEEDAQLLELIEELGTKWTKIGKIIGNRTCKQVRDRYMYSLRPEISRDEWTEEEDELILLRYQIYGSKWIQVALGLPGRSESQIKNRFNLRLKKLLTARKDEEYLEDFKNLKCTKISELSPSTEISNSFDISEDCFWDFNKEKSTFAHDIKGNFENWVIEEQKQICHDNRHVELSGDISMFFGSFVEKGN